MLDTALKRCAFRLAVGSVTATCRVMGCIGQDVWCLTSRAFLGADLRNALVPLDFYTTWRRIGQCESGTEECGNDGGGLHVCFWVFLSVIGGTRGRRSLCSNWSK